MKPSLSTVSSSTHGEAEPLTQASRSSEFKPVFVVVYRFQTRAGREADFLQAWKGLTGMIRDHTGSWGSRLHRASAGDFVAIAQWPDRASWSAARALPPDAERLRAVMRDACETIETLHELETLEGADLSKAPPSPTSAEAPVELSQLYPQPKAGAIEKQSAELRPEHARVIEASPLCMLGTVGPQGADVSPRGGPPGFVVQPDPKTLLLPDHRGNNRLDSFRNLQADPRIGLLFLIPGSNETLRVNGQARVSTETTRLAQASPEKSVRSVLVIDVQEVFHHCPKALLRSQVWDPTTWPSEPPRVSRTPDSRYEGRLYPSPDEPESS